MPYETAPAPSSVPAPIPTADPMLAPPTVRVIGCGGCGINISRMVGTMVGKDLQPMYFDTSMANSRPGESVYVVSHGKGSGSVRAENAAEIEKTVSKMTDAELGLADVNIVIHSLAGGTGSVLGPIMVREYSKRGSKVVVLVVADKSSHVGADNTAKTLKTINNIAERNGIEIPLAIFDNAKGRSEADMGAADLAMSLLSLIGAGAQEVDHNDRINFLDPSKAIKTSPGLRLIDVIGGNPEVDHPLFKYDDNEMYDSVLIIRGHDPAKRNADMEMPKFSRLRKEGQFLNIGLTLVGMLSSDLSPLNDLLDQIDRTLHAAASQKVTKIARLSSDSDDDLVL